ncbi:MAG: BamA/OMP85 family outer membrane protein [Pirellulaceae bacterium]
MVAKEHMVAKKRHKMLWAWATGLSVTLLAAGGCHASDGVRSPHVFTTPVYRTQSPEPPLSEPGQPPRVSSSPLTPGPAFSTVPDRLDPTAEPGGLVLGVSITGNKSVKETEILRHIKTRKDRNYDEQLVQEDLRRLFATRKFHNVRVHRKNGPGGVFVTYEVLERPTIDQVLFIGNQFVTDKKLLKESGLKQGEALNIYTVQEARRKVEEYYRSKGYAKTVVTIDEGDKPADRRVVLRIDEGRVERIWSVRFVGNDPSFVTDARLKTRIASKPGFFKYLFRGKVDSNVIEEDREKLIAYYRGLGYFKARVEPETVYDSSGQWATLTFVIDEGPRYRVRDLSVVGNKKFDAQQLLDRLKLRQGDYFNLDKMQSDENALRDAYGSQGHIFADIKASPRFLEEPGQLDLVYQIEEGDMFRVGKINIHVAGDSPHTRKDVILNRLSLRPGDIVDIREVRASERRLKASDLFISNPTEGTPPQIVIRPPDLAEAASMAERKPAFRGQSPDSNAVGPSARLMVLDVFVPPFKSDQR